MSLNNVYEVFIHDVGLKRNQVLFIYPCITFKVFLPLKLRDLSVVKIKTVHKQNSNILKYLVSCFCAPSSVSFICLALFEEPLKFAPLSIFLGSKFPCLDVQKYIKGCTEGVNLNTLCNIICLYFKTFL